MIKIRSVFFIGILSLVLGVAPAVYAYCGDGVLESAQGEACDDGNFMDRDGCSSYCVVEDISPPTVATISIAEGAQSVPTNTSALTITFSEPIDASSVTPLTISLSQNADPLDARLSVDEAGTVVTLAPQGFLVSEAEHALRISAIKDRLGNTMASEVIRVFKTAAHIDQLPPFIVADPPAGLYPFAQNVSLIAYLSESQKGPGFRDESVRIHYTLDGSYPSETSPLYNQPMAISEHASLKFFGIDGSGNRSPVFTQVYRFECADRPHAERLSPYPLCRILECERGFFLQQNTCIEIAGTGASSSLEENAFTAPLFSSATPITVRNKSAIKITAEHRGEILRPIRFINPSGQNEVYFERGTKITDAEGKAFAGFLSPPVTRYSKDFSINFGYSFKSILEFTPPDGQPLFFNPPFRIIIPITDRFEEASPVAGFSYDLATDQYTPLESDKVLVDLTAKTVSLITDHTGVFFAAQPGENFTKAEFGDLEEHWAKNYAEALYRRGIVKGRQKGVYDPEGVLNRAEFTKIAIGAIGADVLSAEEVEDTYFPDVSLDAWYTPYINRAYELGLIQGYPDGSFRPELPINRAEAIKILIQAFGFNLSEANDFKAEETFPDVDSVAWYYSPMNFAIKYGFLDGVRLPNGKILNDFGPGRLMTRGEMAKLALKTIEFAEN